MLYKYFILLTQNIEENMQTSKHHVCSEQCNSISMFSDFAFQAERDDRSNKRRERRGGAGVWVWIVANKNWINN